MCTCLFDALSKRFRALYPGLSVTASYVLNSIKRDHLYHHFTITYPSWTFRSIGIRSYIKTTRCTNIITRDNNNGRSCGENYFGDTSI